MQQHTRWPGIYTAFAKGLCIGRCRETFRKEVRSSVATHSNGSDRPNFQWMTELAEQRQVRMTELPQKVTSQQDNDWLLQCMRLEQARIRRRNAMDFEETSKFYRDRPDTFISPDRPFSIQIIPELVQSFNAHAFGSSVQSAGKHAMKNLRDAVRMIPKQIRPVPLGRLRIR